MANTKASSGLILLFILGLVLLAVLLAPAQMETGNSYSTNSAGTEGTRLAFDLSRRLGWKSERRDVPFDQETSSATIQALIGVSLGARETHRLLEHARHGGGLLIAGIDGDMADSLHLTSGREGFPLRDRTTDCPSQDPFESVLRGARPIAPIRWTEPPRRDTIGFGTLESPRGAQRAGVGFLLGAGRVVVVADPDFLINDVMRICTTQSDIWYVRMLEYLTGDASGARLAFDEFHHGSGVHGGSLAAIRGYMAGTGSGRMLGQIALAGLLLLMAAAPRPLSPRDPVRIARRSPLEHADALAHAYAAVGATRTATARLLSGVRRRTRRGRAGSRANDEQLLATAAGTAPETVAAVSMISRALAEPLPPRELPGIAAALSTVETALTSRPSTRKS